MASPAIVGVPRRSRWNPDKAIEIAAHAARGNIVPCPVIHGGKILGVLRGVSPFSPAVQWIPIDSAWSYKFGYADYNDLVTEFATRGKFFKTVSLKTMASAAVAQNWYDLWTCGAAPSAATLGGAAATAIAYDDTNASALTHGGNVSPDTKFLLSIVAQGFTQAACCVTIYDRVLDYQSCVYTAGVNTAMTNIATAARYVAAGQPGLQMTWGADTLHNATASNITQVQYTDNDGNPLQNMPTTPNVAIIASAPASAATQGYRIIAPATTATTFTWGPYLPLAQTDTGVRLVDNYTTSAANTGTFVLALVYPLTYVPIVFPTGSYDLDQLFHVSVMERIYDGACLNFMIWRASTTTIGGSSFGCTFGWG